MGGFPNITPKSISDISPRSFAKDFKALTFGAKPWINRLAHFAINGGTPCWNDGTFIA